MISSHPKGNQRHPHRPEAAHLLPAYYLSVMAVLEDVTKAHHLGLNTVRVKREYKSNRNSHGKRHFLCKDTTLEKLMWEGRALGLGNSVG